MNPMTPAQNPTQSSNANLTRELGSPALPGAHAPITADAGREAGPRRKIVPIGIAVVLVLGALAALVAFGAMNDRSESENAPQAAPDNTYRNEHVDPSRAPGDSPAVPGDQLAPAGAIPAHGAIQGPGAPALGDPSIPR